QVVVGVGLKRLVLGIEEIGIGEVALEVIEALVHLLLDWLRPGDISIRRLDVFSHRRDRRLWHVLRGPLVVRDQFDWFGGTGRANHSALAHGASAAADYGLLAQIIMRIADERFPHERESAHDAGDEEQREEPEARDKPRARVAVAIGEPAQADADEEEA